MKLRGRDVDQLSAQIVTHDINSCNFFNLINVTFLIETIT